jgi:BirA family biotin operon repressor/biotin-[acetyl-CoA-carboxylase] ligase
MASTNDFAKELARQGAPEGTVVQAGVQTGGKGRLGRTWISPPGGLWLSLIVRPPLPAEKCSSLALLVSLWVIECLEKRAALPFEVYWPNDIYVRRKKLGGILLESSVSKGGVDWIVAGMGLNVNNETDGLPDDLKAVSLSSLGIAADLTEIRNEILCRIEKQYRIFCRTGSAPFIPLLRSKLGMTGRYVELTEISGKRKVKVLDLGLEGELLVDAGGVIETIRSAERVRLLD